MFKHASRFPRIGMRIVKSAVSVGICFLIDYRKAYNI